MRSSRLIYQLAFLGTVALGCGAATLRQNAGTDGGAGAGGTAGSGIGGSRADGGGATGGTSGDASAGSGNVALGSATAFVRRGASQTVAVSVARNGATGNVNLTVAVLPPGVTADPLAITGSATTGSLVVHASATATEGATTVTVTAMGGVNGTAALRLLVGGAPGTPDESFAGDGTFSTTVPGTVLIGRGLALDGDGVLVTGSTDTQAITARVRGDGTFDTTFGGGGFVSTGTGTYSEGIAITKVATGRIIVAGVANGTSAGYEFGLFGYTAAGALDAAFGSSGVASFNPGIGYGELHCIADAGGGSVIVAGTLFASSGPAETRALRYSYVGVQDTTFNVDEPNVFLESMAIQPDGKLVLAGSTASVFWIARYGANGVRDSGFGTSGAVTTDFSPNTAQSHGMAVLPDGKLLAIGIASDSSSNHWVALARYNLNGSPDLSFGVAGKVTTALAFNTQSPNAVAVDGSGRVVFVGVAGGKPAVARINADGSVDTTFGTAGMAAVDFGVAGTTTSTGGYGIALDADGRIVFAADIGAAGAQQMAVARLWP